LQQTSHTTSPLNERNVISGSESGASCHGAEARRWKQYHGRWKSNQEIE